MRILLQTTETSRESGKQTKKERKENLNAPFRDTGYYLPVPGGRILYPSDRKSENMIQ